jgi:hypothetical protein
MKYALCFRGISYYRDFPHDGSCKPFLIDFTNYIPYWKKNVIDPLIQQGHEVDVFMWTYPSDKLSDIVNYIKPRNYELGVYQYARPGTGASVYNGILKVLNLVKKEESVSYDYIIVSRFDNIVFEKITNVFIPEDALTTVTPRDDNLFILSGNLLDTLIQKFTILNNHNILTHDYTAIFSKEGIRCHTMYSHVYISKRYPFLKTARQLFTDKNSSYYLCDIDELYDENSLCYSFCYKNNTVYTPYEDPNITCKDPKNHIPGLL